MVVIAFIPLLVCILGIFLYAVTTNPTLKEVSRAMIWTGMLAFLLATGAKQTTLHLGQGPAVVSSRA